MSLAERDGMTDTRSQPRAEGFSSHGPLDVGNVCRLKEQIVLLYMTLVAYVGLLTVVRFQAPE